MSAQLWLFSLDILSLCHLVWFFCKHWVVSKDFLFWTAFILMFFKRILGKQFLPIWIFRWRCCSWLLFYFTWLTFDFYLVQSRCHIVFIIILWDIFLDSFNFYDNLFRYELASCKLSGLHINFFKKRFDSTINFWLIRLKYFWLRLLIKDFTFD